MIFTSRHRSLSIPFAPAITAVVTATTIAVALLVAAPQAAHAQTTLFSDFGAGNSYNTMIARPESGPTSGFAGITAFQFTPTNSGVVNSMSAALYNLSGSKSLTAEILNNNGGLPGSTVLFSASGTDASSPGGIVTFSSASGSNLTAGTLYWAEIVASSDGQNGWYENSTGVTGKYAYSTNNGASYPTTGTSPTTAFSLSGTAAAAPEPGSVAFLALVGLPMVGALVHRRKVV